MNKYRQNCLFSTNKTPEFVQNCVKIDKTQGVFLVAARWFFATDFLVKNLVPHSREATQIFTDFALRAGCFATVGHRPNKSADKLFWVV